VHTVSSTLLVFDCLAHSVDLVRRFDSLATEVTENELTGSQKVWSVIFQVHHLQRSRAVVLLGAITLLIADEYRYNFTTLKGRPCVCDSLGAVEPWYKMNAE